jgi:polyadenylate-binding protein
MMDYYQNKNQNPKQAKPIKALNTNVVLYLGELPPDVDQYELHQFIMSFGKFNIESLVVKPTKENKAYAYVKFKSKLEMEKSKKILHLQTLRDYVIKAEAFRQKESLKEDAKASYPDGSLNTNLFVKNLSITTTPKELYELFSKFGDIISIKLKQNKKGECIGYGYVNYENSSSAEEAINNLNDFEFSGKRLYVSQFSSKKERSEEDKFPLILIKQLPPALINEKNLEEIFSRFGQISVCGIVNNEIKNEGQVENSKIGVVLFIRKEEASIAVESLNNKTIDNSGIPILLSLAPINKETIEKLWKAKQESFKNKYEGCNLVVKNIPKEITEKNLFEICKRFGDIAGARIATEGKMKEIRNADGVVTDKEFIYESKGYGFVLFRNILAAKAAKEALNNNKFEFKNTNINFVVEYYDYSKGEKNQFFNQNKKISPSPNKKKYNQNNNFNNRGKGRGGNYRQPQRNLNTSEDKIDQSVVINNRTVINPKTQIMNKVTIYLIVV